MKEFNILDFGARPDSDFDNANAIQKAIDKCSEYGGGKVIIPSKNKFMSGPFDLKSDVTLYVESDAHLIANPDESVYTKSAFKENLGEGTIWIGGENSKNICIEGFGIIDGNGIKFMGPEEKAAFILKDFEIIDPRPHLLTLINIKNLTIRDVTFKDSAYWCLHIIGCDNVKIESVTILNNLKIRNSDGIDLDHSKNVRISNCYIESADDCICFKTRREYEEHGPTENVVVNNCIMTSTSCSIKLGSENMDAIRNVLITNCIIKSSNRGIGIQNRDEGVVENVSFDNIIVEGRLFDDVWWGKAEPIYITAYKRKSDNHRDSNWRFAKGQTEGKVGKVSNIKFSNIDCRSENGIFVGGEPDKISNIQFSNVQLEINKLTKYKGNLYDLRPSATVGILETDIAGVYVDTASELYFDNCKLKWGNNRESYFKHATYFKNVSNLKMDKFSGHSADEKIEPHKFINCTDVNINS